MVNQELDLTSLEEDIDPAFAHATADEAASPEEERALGAVMDIVRSMVYSEEGMAKVANVLQQDKRPLLQKIPDILGPILLRAKSQVEEASGEPVPGSVFFGEGGAMEQSIDVMFELADQLKLPGASDPDQFSGAMMGLYKKAGEHILETGDTDSRKEAAKLAAQMALTQPDGNMQDPDEFMRKNQDSLSGEIREALANGVR